MKPTFRILAMTLALTSSRCEGPLNPSTFDPHIQPEFDIAVCRLQDVVSNFKNVKPSDFFYFPRTPTLQVGGCGAYQLKGHGYVFGHFTIPNQVHYSSNCPQVIRHELGHAILFKLKDPHYRCWEHYPEWEAGIERFQDCPLAYLKPSRRCPE